VERTVGAVREDASPQAAPVARTLAILPAYNEEAVLGRVLIELMQRWPELDVLVVDDGSTDGTAAVARERGVPVASLPFNLGIGAALQTGFRYALQHGYARAIQFDSDGQHDPTQVSVLLDALDGGADLVIGSRFAAPEADYEVSPVRGGAMRLLRASIRILTGQRFTDASSGFRGFSAPMLAFYARHYPTEYMESAEALMMACQSGFRIVEVPVTMRVRAGGSPSNRHFKLVYHYLRVLVAIFSRTPLRRRPAARRRVGPKAQPVEP
jgi:glycosyltransferase involved in cell wall biosynthesis